MVRTPGPDPHFPDAFAAGRLDLLAEMPVLRLAEVEAVQVRTPDQALDDHAPLGRLAQYPGHLGTGAGQPLVRIAPPVGVEHDVAGPGFAQRGEQLGEVGPPVPQSAHLVAGTPGPAVGTATVQAGVRVAPLIAGEEPPVQRHDIRYPIVGAG